MSLSWPLLVWAGISATLIAEWLGWLARANGWTRLSSTRTFGCLLTARTEAKRTWLVGITLNFALGAIVVPMIYGLIFELTGRADAINGIMIGAGHGLLFGAMLPLLGRAGKCTGIHATPGFFGWRLGRATPVSLILNRIIYGAVLGYVYVVPPGG